MSSVHWWAAICARADMDSAKVNKLFELLVTTMLQMTTASSKYLRLLLPGTSCNSKQATVAFSCSSYDVLLQIHVFFEHFRSSLES